MSIFASRKTKTVEIPFDPPHTVTITALAGRHLAKAQALYFNELVAGVTERGGAKVQKDIEQLFTRSPKETAEAIAKVQADPMNGFDKATLVRYGVTGWSYETKVSQEALDDLTDEATDFLSEQVLRLTKPSLFQGKDEAEADRKNDSRSFTAV
jgi:hypothetical protein